MPRGAGHLLGPECRGRQPPARHRQTPPAAPAGAQLQRLPAAAPEAQCQHHRHHGQTRPAGAAVAVGCPRRLHPRLGPTQRRGFLGRGVTRPQYRTRHCRCTGLLGVRHPHPQHRHLPGGHPQRAPLHECAAGRRCRQTRDRAQGRAQTRWQRGGADPLGCHRRQRRRVRRRTAPRWRSAGAHLLAVVFGRTLPGLALPTIGPPPGRGHQRRWPGCAGSRLGQRAAAATGPPRRTGHHHPCTQTLAPGVAERPD